MEDEINGQGLFTHYLVLGLSGKANRDRNAVVDHLELYSYLASKVPEGAKLLSGDRSQSPVLYLGTDTTGLFALARLDPAKVITGTSEAPPPRPRPSVEALTASRRLMDKDYGNWQNDAASLLAEVDRNLTLTNPQLLQSPFHDETTSRRVAAFLTLALAAHRQQPPVPVRIPASLAVAEFYSHDDSTKFKAEQFDALAQAAGLRISLDPFSFEVPTDPAVQSMRGHLLHAFAASRSSDDAKARRAAILAYAELTPLLAHARGRGELTAGASATR